MKLTNLDQRIHVLKNSDTVMTTISNIANSGLQDEAFYVLELRDIVRKHQNWKEKLPRVQPFYAVKCNDDLITLKVLASLGANFDCASQNEIKKVLGIGVDSSRIIFANPAKPVSHLCYAANVGVLLMTADNETELHKIKRVFSDAKIVLRIRCDAKIASGLFGMKFGCDPIHEAPNIIKVARLLNLDVVGISFHVGTGCQDPPVFERAIRHARNLFNLAIEIGFKPYILDLGGGYPGDKDTSIDKIADVINDALDTHFPTDDVQIIAEPGRYYVASAFTLATAIHSKRYVHSQNDSLSTVDHILYYINDGVYGSFNCIFFDKRKVTPIPLRDGYGKMIPSSIWGPTCDGLDQVVENMLMHEMNGGDWLIFENMGAYTLPAASSFNGFPIPKVYAVADESVWLLLKDTVPLTDEHFVFDDNSVDLPFRLDVNDKDVNAWNDSSMELSSSHSELSSGDDEEEILAVSVAPPPFIYEYLEVEPLK